MGLASNPAKNLLSYGRGIARFRETGKLGYYDFGETPTFNIKPTVTSEPFYTSRYGVQERVHEMLSEKGGTVEMEFFEQHAENVDFFFYGEGVVTEAQVGGTLDGTEVTPADGLWIDVGKLDCSVLKLSHGAVTGGPFTVGETVTGGTSAATGKVAWKGEDYMELVAIAGTFAGGETITGGTSSATAVVTVTETLDDAVVTDNAGTPTTRYVSGVDYEFDGTGGMIFKPATASTITGACFLSADYAGLSNKSVKALKSAYREGELLFVGKPDEGPRWRVIVWKARLTLSGSMQMITNGPKAIGVTAQMMSAREDHPDYPFFKPTQLRAA